MKTYNEVLDELKNLKYVEDVNYLEIGDGWYDLVTLLCKRINVYLDWANRQDANAGYIRVVQIKSKFGGLRFYYDSYTTEEHNQYIRGLIDFAEEMSVRICEKCGHPGKQRNLSWVATLCDEHYKEINNKLDKV